MHPDTIWGKGKLTKKMIVMTFCKELEYQKLQQIQKRKWSNIRLMNLESIFLSNAWIIRNFHDAMQNSSMCHQNVNFWLIRSHGTQMSEITCVASVWLEPGTWGLWVCMMLSVLSNPAYSLSWPILIKFDVPESISSLVNRDGWGRPVAGLVTTETCTQQFAL